MKIHYNQEGVVFAEFRLGYIAIDSNGRVSGDLSTRDVLAYDLCALLALTDEVFGRKRTCVWKRPGPGYTYSVQC